MADLTHFDQDGRAHMVDVGSKPVTSRRAVAAGQITMAAETVEKIRQGGFARAMCWLLPDLPASWARNRQPA